LDYRVAAVHARNGSCTTARGGRRTMNNIFYIIGVVVVVLFILGYFGLR
jgi:hypothetical protein